VLADQVTEHAVARSSRQPAAQRPAELALDVAGIEPDATAWTETGDRSADVLAQRP
jgi:hypothetical protein